MLRVKWRKYLGITQWPLFSLLSVILFWNLFQHMLQQPTRPRFLGLRLRPDPCLVETRDWDWDLKVSEVETETKTDHFWSRPRLRLRLAHGFISKSGATYVQVEMKILLFVLSLGHFWPKHNVLYWFLIFKTLDGAKSKHELVCIGNKNVQMG